jgi:hypothetical protein
MALWRIRILKNGLAGSVRVQYYEFFTMSTLHPSSVYLESPAYRILRRPILRHELVDDGGQGRCFVVSPGKLTARNERNARRGQVAPDRLRCSRR